MTARRTRLDAGIACNGFTEVGDLTAQGVDFGEVSAPGALQRKP